MPTLPCTPTGSSRPARAHIEEEENVVTAEMTREEQTAFEAAAFRRLVAHLRTRTDVQNIDLMNLAGFCRNCLSTWYGEAAAEAGIALTKEQSREIICGMPYAEWQQRFQAEATPVQKAAFAANKPKE
jgi:uncharacterized protein